MNYIDPDPSVRILLPDNSVDLVCCFGVLHHIPNVSFVLREIGRCLSPGGHLLVREPIVSMGDWRYPCGGLTKRERGIPLPIFRTGLRQAGLDIVQEAKCMFSLMSKAAIRLHLDAWNTPSIVVMDRAACIMFGWNRIYHATSVIQKIRPTSVFIVARKSVA